MWDVIRSVDRMANGFCTHFTLHIHHQCKHMWFHVCYCRRKPVKGQSQRKGQWITFDCVLAYVHGPHSLWRIGRAPGGYHAVMSLKYRTKVLLIDTLQKLYSFAMYADHTSSGGAVSSSGGLQTTQSTVSTVYDTEQSSAVGALQPHDYDSPNFGQDQKHHVYPAFTRRPVHPHTTQTLSINEDYMEMLALQDWMEQC